MLSLIFKKKQLDSASIPVRWCLDEEALAAVKGTGLIPYILIEIEYENRGESTFALYPIEQLTAYLDVHYPGNVNIRAHVVTAEENRKDAIQKCFMIESMHQKRAMSACSYYIHVGRNNKKIQIDTYDSSTWYQFEVSENLFGKEYWPWLKFLINRYYENKPKDQCHQRRRLLMFPLTTMWIILVEFLAYEIFFGACYLILLLAAKPMSAQSILHPFDTTMYRFKRDFLNSQFVIGRVQNWVGKLNKKHGNIYSAIASILLIPFIPIYAILAIVVLSRIIPILSMTEIITYWIFGTYAVIAATGLIISACYLLYLTIRFICEKTGNWLPENNPIMDAIDNLFDWVSDTWFKFEEWIINYGLNDINDELLKCPTKDGECLPPIRWRDKTLAVMFADVKNKVCKPMRG